MKHSAPPILTLVALRAELPTPNPQQHIYKSLSTHITRAHYHSHLLHGTFSGSAVAPIKIFNGRKVTLTKNKPIWLVDLLPPVVPPLLLRKLLSSRRSLLPPPLPLLGK